MVNTGKPSSGCYMCRARRIKCDEAKPHCMRCQKSRRACPGYRDSFELQHRDGTISTRRKNPLQIGKHASTFPIAGQLPTQLHQQAACFFLSNFVLVPQTGTTTRYLSFLVPLLRTAKPDSPLNLTFAAVALAAFGSRPDARSLLPRADLFYARALRVINSALKNPDEALDDATLASVILLFTYEQVKASHKSHSGYVCHIDGAVALIKSRGKAQFKSTIGRELFLQVRAHMIVRCVANSQAVPEDVQWWINQIEEDEIERTISKMSLHLAKLRADAEPIITLVPRTFSNNASILKILRRAETLEKEFVEWEKSLPLPWKPKILAWVDESEDNLPDSDTHPGKILSFSELRMAYTLNVSWANRLFLWTTIVRCIAWLAEPQDYKLAPEYEAASLACGRIIEDIVASTPYFLGWNGSDAFSIDRKTNFACGTSEQSSVPAIKCIPGIFVLWPLFAAANSDFVSPSQRLFLKGRMKTIYDHTGISQANVLLKSAISFPSTYILRERMNISKTDLSPFQVHREKVIHNSCIFNLEDRLEPKSPPPSPSPAVEASGINLSWMLIMPGSDGKDYVNEYGSKVDINPGSGYKFPSMTTV